jgi:molybdopterin converting factor small subunit
MTVSVLIPDELSKYSDGQLQVEVEAATVGDALESLFMTFPNLQKRLVNENRHFYPYVPAFLNDEKLPLQGTLNRQLKDGDQLAFMLIASGG